MLLTIFNLPINTRYNDIKSLLQFKCGFKDMILDNLMTDGANSRKVTVGLAEEEDAALLMKEIHGYFMNGQQLYVESHRKKQREDPIPPVFQPSNPQPNLQQPYYQQCVTPSVPEVNNIYGDALNQTAFANYGYPLQAYQSMNPNFTQSNNSTNMGGAPLGFNDSSNKSSSWSNECNWNPADNSRPVWEQNSQGVNFGWENPVENRKRPNSEETNLYSRRESPPRKYERRSPPRDHHSRNFEKESSSRHSRRDRSPRDFGHRVSATDHGRYSPSRNFERDGILGDHRQDGSMRDRGQGASNDNYGRNATSRVRARDTRDRGRDSNSRNYGRRSPVRDSLSTRKNDRRDQNRRISPFRETPRNSSSSKLYGEHVTNPIAFGNKNSRQRNEFGKSQPKNQRNSRDVRNVAPRNSGSKTEVQFRKHEGKVLTEKQIVARAFTWQGQATSALAKDMMKREELKMYYTPANSVHFMKLLKRIIRERLVKLLNKDVLTPMEEMEAIYRFTFQTSTDADLFKEVGQIIEDENAEREASKTESQNGGDIKDTKHSDDAETPAALENNLAASSNVLEQPFKPKQQEVSKKNLMSSSKEHPTNSVKTNKTVDLKNKKPLTDKQIRQAQKKENAQIFKDEEILLSKLEPNFKKQLELEAETIRTIIEEDLQEEPPQDLKTIHERVRNTVVDDLLKVIKINCAKRVLNVGPILVRIFCIPKIISKGQLEPILLKHGITNIKKSAKRKAMYIGNCATYKIQDKLCNMDPLVVGCSKILIKPFQLSGEQQSQRMSRKQLMEHRQKIFATFDNGDDNTEQLKDENIYEDADFKDNESQCNDNTQAVKQESIKNGNTSANIEMENKDNQETFKDNEKNIKIDTKLEDIKEENDVIQKANNSKPEHIKLEPLSNVTGDENASEVITEEVKDEIDDNTKDEDANVSDDATENQCHLADDIDIDDLNDDDFEDW